MKHVTVSQVKLLRCENPTAILDSKLLSKLLIEVMISAKNEHVLICDLSNYTLKGVFDT